MEGARITCLFFDGHYILGYFWHSSVHNFGYFSAKLRNCETTFLRKPAEISQNMPTFISIEPPITK